MKSVFVASFVAVTMVVTGAVAQQSQAPSQTPGGQSSPSDQSSGSQSVPPSTSSPSSEGTPSSGGSSSGASQPSASPSTGQGPVQVDANSIIGSTVRSGDGKDLGKVSRLMVDPNEGRISSVTIGIGGMLGMGQKEVSVPWNSVKVGQDGGKVILTVDQGLLQQAPRAEDKKSRGEQGAASPSTGGTDKKNQNR